MSDERIAWATGYGRGITADEQLPHIADDEAVELPPVPRWGPLALAGFIGLVVCTNIAAASWGKLVNDSPEALLLLSSRNRYLALAVPSGISPVTWTLLATLRVGLAAVVCHLVGRAYGERVLRWFSRYLGMRQQQVTQIESGFRTAEIPLIAFFAGSNIVWALTGITGTRIRRMVACFIVGFGARLALLWWVAKRYEAELTDVLEWLAKYQWWIVGGSILLVVLVNVRNLRGR